MNFFIMINYRKIRSKIKSKENYLKVLLKEVGTTSPKKYSSIIVNDMKLDFSINLNKKPLNIKPAINNNTFIRLNSKKIKNEGKMDIMRDKSAEIRRNNMQNEKNNKKVTYVKPKIINKDVKIYAKKKPEMKRTAKTPDKFKKTLRLVTAVNKMKKLRDISNDQIVNKKNGIINQKALENHEKPDLEDNFITQKFPYVRKKTFVGDSREKLYRNLKSYNNNINRDNNVDNNKGNNKVNNKEPIKNKNEKIDNNVGAYSDTNITRNTKKNKTFIKESNNNNLELLSDKINPGINGISTFLKQNTIDIKNIEEKFLEPKNYKSLNKKYRETFCEGFFISSFPFKKGQVVEKSQSFPALCGHDECSSLPSMQPEIIFRYPLEDTKNLELNDLAATICFPTGIKVCYSNEENNKPKRIENYVTPITNQKGERYYMVNYHFYLRMENAIYNNKYEMHPLKDHLKRFADDYINMDENDMDKNKEKIEKDLEQAQNLGFRDFVYIPYCICLISKYPYVDEIKKCLETIYYLITEKDQNELINKLIMHLINSVPIPEIETMVQFYIPYNNEDHITIKYPKLNDLKIMNSSICNLLKYFPIDLIIYVFRLLLFEKKILFIDDDYTRLSNATDNFISLLYPFQWIHTYIPIMSDQMLQYLETFLPFINGINISLLPLVKELYQTGDMEQNEEIFLVYIQEKKFRLGSSLIGKGKKKYKYFEENVPALPNNLEKGLRNKLKKIKDEIEYFEKRHPGSKNLEKYEINIRIAFIEFFVEMFHDIDKYLSFLDEDIVFNKNLFMEKIQKNNKKFYDEFTDTQLFQLFTQNIVKDDFNYFKLTMEDYNKNQGKFTYDNDKIKNDKIFSIKEKYIIPPDYLNIKEKKAEIITDQLNQKYNIKQKENVNKQITEYMQKIEDKNYDTNNLNIYVIPKETKSGELKININIKNNILTNKENQQFVMKQLKKYSKIRRKDEMSQKEQDELKERIKDLTLKIFKSEELKIDDDNLKKEIGNDLNTNIGREFFVNLISKNTNNIILLKNYCFTLLGKIIYNIILLSLLNVAENDVILEQVVRLLKSLKFFAQEETGELCRIIKGQKKCTLTLWDIYRQRIQSYSKVNQANLWKKWYNINLANKKEERNEPDTIKNAILCIIDIMFDLELDITFIKKTIEGIMKIDLKDNEEKKNEILQTIQKLYTEKNKKTKKM